MLIKHWVDDYNARHRICDENHRESKEGHLNKSHEYSEFLQKMNALNIHQIEQLLTLDESSCSIFLECKPIIIEMIQAYIKQAPFSHPLMHDTDVRKKKLILLPSLSTLINTNQDSVLFLDIVGPSNVGKTQLALTTAVLQARAHEEAEESVAGSNDVIYLTTQKHVILNRLHRMISSQSIAKQASLEVLQMNDLEYLMDYLHSLCSCHGHQRHESRPALVIIDSLSDLFHFSDDQVVGKSFLHAIGQTCRHLVFVHQMAILTLSSSSSNNTHHHDKSKEVKSVLDPSWFAYPQAQIYLEQKPPAIESFVRLTKSYRKMSNPNTFVSLIITERGVEEREQLSETNNNNKN